MIIVPKIAQLFWLGSATLFWQAQNPPAGLIMQMRLYVNDVAPNLDSVLATFTEALFPGYGPQTVGVGLPNPFTNADNFAQVNFPTFHWVPANNNTDQVVYGWYLTIIGAPIPLALLAAEKIVPAVPMNRPGAEVRVQPKLTLGSRFAS